MWNEHFALQLWTVFWSEYIVIALKLALFWNRLACCELYSGNSEWKMQNKVELVYDGPALIY